MTAARIKECSGVTITSQAGERISFELVTIVMDGSGVTNIRLGISSPIVKGNLLLNSAIVQNLDNPNQPPPVLWLNEHLPDTLREFISSHEQITRLNEITAPVAKREPDFSEAIELLQQAAQSFRKELASVEASELPYLPLFQQLGCQAFLEQSL